MTLFYSMPKCHIEPTNGESNIHKNAATEESAHFLNCEHFLPALLITYKNSTSVQGSGFCFPYTELGFFFCVDFCEYKFILLCPS